MTIIYDDVVLDVTASVAETAIIGSPYRPLVNGGRYRSTGKTQIGPGCWIGEGVQVGEGATMGDNSILHGDSRVESDARIGKGVLLTYRSWVDLGATIGDDCVIGGFVCERAVVGRGCRVFGDLVHRQQNPLCGWDDADSEEESPVLEDEVFVGWGAKVIGWSGSCTATTAGWSGARPPMWSGWATGCARGSASPWPCRP
jgi:carbonic anhydrase/acetyltransferase-like protein (isoleucine patch superfamily)